MSSKKVFPCNTCDLVFDNSQAQRTHMREPWHVYNLKRRMADLPPISEDAYTENVATDLVSSKQELSNTISSSALRRSSPEAEPLEDSDEQASTNRCLFCSKDSASLETNLEHMYSDHGLYIPEIEHLSSLETIIRYLRTVITEYNECLYCGTTKPSVEGVRRHMLDKGHCMINLEREPELLEFWELSDSDEDDHDDDGPLRSQDRTSACRDSIDGEYTLPSGKVVGSKTKAREARQLARRITSTAKGTSDGTITEGHNENTDVMLSVKPADSAKRTPEGTRNRAVAVRDARGLIGVSDQQVRSLITVQRKMQRQQAVVQASAAWADELGGRSQKHYKVKMNLRAG